jgi:putative NADH-flavin reductase
MKLIIFGATGKLGQELVKSALSEGYEVTAYVRASSSLANKHERLTVITGNVLDKADVNNAINGQDAVLSALGAKLSDKEPVVSKGTQNIVEAMQLHQVQRLICVTALGVGDSYKQTSLLGKLGAKTFMKSLFADKRLQERIVKESGLAWTIVRPAILTDKPQGTVKVNPSHRLGLVATVPRASVAKFMLQQLGDKTYLQKYATVVS